MVRSMVHAAVLSGAFSLLSSCNHQSAEPQALSENGYWKTKPYQTTVRLYNGERMPVTRYKKVWVDTTSTASNVENE